MKNLDNDFYANHLDEPWLFFPADRHGSISRREFYFRVNQLEDKIKSYRTNDQQKVVLVCERPENFRLAFVAVIASGMTALLAASRKPAMLQRLFEQYPESLLMTDTDSSCAPASTIIMTDFTADQSVPAGDVKLPQVSYSLLAAILFTSGSTGKPKANHKHWGDLIKASALMRQRLQLTPQDCLLVAVQPQHMYGFETQVLMPLLGGIGLFASRLFYPADIYAAMKQLQENGIKASLVITPIQLRAMLGSGLDFSPLRQIVCSAAALSVNLARQAESQWKIPLTEIFGSTELGSVASRRTAKEELWKLYPQVNLQSEGNAYRVNADYLPHQPLLDDTIELDEKNPRVFRLLGRASDLIKVAGKRASLMALNNRLLDIPGVIDGVFVMPGDARENPRPCALVVAPDLNRETLFSALAEWLDPVFLPRPVYFVDRLPRETNGKLPRIKLMQLIEQLQKTTPESIDILSSVSPEHPALGGHFPGNSVIPGVVLLELVESCLEKHLGTRWGTYWVRQWLRVKFSRRLEPGQQCRVVIKFDSQNLQKGSFKLLDMADHTLVTGQLYYAESEAQA